MDLLRDTYAEINLNHLAHNTKLMRRQIGDSVKMAAVLKANAYGHGACEIADTLLQNGADLLAVATLSEAVVLRQTYPDAELFIMGHTPDRLLQTAYEHNCIITLFTYEQAEILNRFRGARVHLKIDTGFHRLGFSCDSKSVHRIGQIARLGNLRIEGIFTHLALSHTQGDQLQFEQFMWFIGELERMGLSVLHQHICDSIATTRYPNYRLNMVRLGAILYGMLGTGQDLPVKQVLKLKSRLSRVAPVKKGEGVSYDYFWKAKEDTLIGTLPIGYADGYPRQLTHGGTVYLNGVHAPIAGIVCMDQLMVDLHDVPNAKEGDEVVLYGADEGLPISEIARLCQTNKNDILARISARVPRVYIK